ncbi:amino acid ABC transporter permease [Roseomonas fluvialis]|uniref:ABC transporter permease n=1 Tax=Roseomonas fluvialis TaxID=1750527 RepID=A0ABM7YAP8_9PROT|nr:amino acid ABC transporter permease [Roseomonas fluvialis]BDG75162.1 ABC transporter permease [Roseomonas fluvialis]
MNYSLIYSQVTPHIPYLLGGAVLTLQLAVISFIAGWAIGLVNASVLHFGPRPARAAVQAYVTFFINTPLLVQIFFIFFVLPDAGILLSPYAAVAIGMSLNAGAYLTEIQRAGFQSLRREEIDAATAMGFSVPQMVWYVILPHIAKALYPPLSNQFIIQVMTTSIASIFAVEELTGRAYNVNSLTFRSLEVFSITALIYVVLTLACSLALALIGRWLFRVKARIL